MTNTQATVLDQPRPVEMPLPGIRHATWAGHEDGIRMSVWRQTVAPGGATPPHSHDCEEIVLCLSGQGEVHTRGQVHRFGPDQTVVLPAGEEHQLFNTGTQPLETLGLFAASPVGVFLPDGQKLELPWRT